MKRRSPVWFLVFAVVAACLSYLIVDGVEHGFPFIWVTVTPSDVSQIPIIGSLFGWVPPSFDFNFLGFFLDVAFYFTLSWGIYWFATRKKR